MKNSIIDSHFVDDICRIINEGQAEASKAVVSVAITTYWNIGKRNLAYYRKFYLVFPNYEILHTCVQNLSWSHIRLLIHIENEEERQWYLTETISGTWSVRTLERNIASQYYGRRLFAVSSKLKIYRNSARTSLD